MVVLSLTCLTHPTDSEVLSHCYELGCSPWPEGVALSIERGDLGQGEDPSTSATLARGVALSIEKGGDLGQGEENLNTSGVPLSKANPIQRQGMYPESVVRAKGALCPTWLILQGEREKEYAKFLMF